MKQYRVLFTAYKVVGGNMEMTVASSKWFNSQHLAQCFIDTHFCPNAVVAEREIEARIRPDFVGII